MRTVSFRSCARNPSLFALAVAGAGKGDPLTPTQALVLRAIDNGDDSVALFMDSGVALSKDSYYRKLHSDGHFTVVADGTIAIVLWTYSDSDIKSELKFWEDRAKHSRDQIAAERKELVVWLSANSGHVKAGLLVRNVPRTRAGTRCGTAEETLVCDPGPRGLRRRSSADSGRSRCPGPASIDQGDQRRGRKLSPTEYRTGAGAIAVDLKPRCVWRCDDCQRRRIGGPTVGPAASAADIKLGVKYADQGRECGRPALCCTVRRWRRASNAAWSYSTGAKAVTPPTSAASCGNGCRRGL